jgi:hypothetical protein
MTVYRIVPVLGVVILQMMNVVFAMVIIAAVQIVQAFPMAMPKKIIVGTVTTTLQMTVLRIVPAHGVVVLN